MDISTDVIIDCEFKTDKWADVCRCLNVLYATRMGTLALDRDFGIDWSFLDQPMEMAKAMIESELITKTRKYEKRAVVERVLWEGNYTNGNIQPKVVIALV
jgi:hypothetical protein